METKKIEESAERVAYAHAIERCAAEAEDRAKMYDDAAAYHQSRSHDRALQDYAAAALRIHAASLRAMKPEGAT